MQEQELKKRAAAFVNPAAPVKPEIIAPSRSQLHSKRSFFRNIILTIVTIPIIGTAFGAYSSMTAPMGKITSPAAGSKTGRVVKIEGYTKNIPQHIRNIWLVVEMESLGLCWPKRPIYKPNSPFKTTIHENGPNKEYTVALYAVDQICQAEILTWFEIAQNPQTEPGLEIPPGCFKLDSVKLTLQNI